MYDYNCHIFSPFYEHPGTKQIIRYCVLIIHALFRKYTIGSVNREDVLSLKFI